MCLQTAAHVMRNMLLSHAKAYKAIKALPGLITLCIESGNPCPCLTWQYQGMHALLLDGVTPTIELHSRETSAMVCKKREGEALMRRIVASWSPRVRAGGSEVEVGVVHNVFWTEPKRHGLLYTHVRYAPHMQGFRITAPCQQELPVFRPASYICPSCPLVQYLMLCILGCDL